MTDDQLVGAIRQRVTTGGPRLPAPASPAAIVDAEQRTGQPLPRLLGRLYLEVGNGGFGPGYGILGVRGGHTDDLHHTAVDLFPWQWAPPAPPAATAVLLPICYWGCGIYSLVDCADPRAGMWGWDPNGVPPDDRGKALHDQAMTLAEWLERWLQGRLYQPVSVQDPSSERWRGATDQEYATWLAEMES